MTLFFVFWGLILWAAATVIFRGLGQFFFTPEKPLFIILTFVVIVPLILVATYPIYAWQKVSISQRPIAAISIAFPGMLLDVLSVSFFSTVFPNLSPEVDHYFAAGLLWAYGLTVLTGLTFNQPTETLSENQ